MIRPWTVALACAALGASLIGVGVFPERIAPIEITYVYSTDIAGMLTPLLDRFNSDPPKVMGHPIHVTGVALSSGDAERDIAVGIQVADVWTPAASVWGSLLTDRSDALSGSIGVNLDAKSIVTSPQVIAMGRSCAEEVGWSPSDQLSWEQVVDLAATDGSNTRHCRGFTLGGTSPLSSTSGLLALASWYGVASSTQPLLRAELQQNGPAQEQVRQIERLVIKYWDTSVTAMDHICENKPQFVTAIYLQENTLVTHNTTKCLKKVNHLGMVGVYPTGGTYVADYPFYLVSRPDSTLSSEQASNALYNWLGREITAEVAGRFGFRTATGVAGGLIDDEHGAVPSLPDLSQVLELPTADVTRWLQDRWIADCRTGGISCDIA